MEITKLKDIKLSVEMMDADQVSSYVNDEILKTKDVTEIEVFPTNVDIPVGTIDSVESLSSLFSWSLEKLELQSKMNWTGLEYKDAVLSNNMLELTIKTHTLKEDSDIVVDFGDGSEPLVVKSAPISDEGVIEYTPEISSLWKDYKECSVKISHTYSSPNINCKMIVKVIGNDMFTFRAYISSSSKSVCSRVFDGLKFSKRIENISSGFKSNRIQKLYLPEYRNLSIKNWASAFCANKNLIEVIVEDSEYNFTNLYLTMPNMFDGCINLTTSNFRLPVYASINSTAQYARIYADCSSLTSDISDLLPSNGFIGRKICLTDIFKNCKSITGNISAYADILWNDTSKKWSLYRSDNTAINAFIGCLNLDLDIVPVYWGGNKTDDPVETEEPTVMTFNIPYGQQAFGKNKLSPLQYTMKLASVKYTDWNRGTVKVDWGDGSEMQTLGNEEVSHTFTTLPSIDGNNYITLKFYGMDGIVPSFLAVKEKSDDSNSLEPRHCLEDMTCGSKLLRIYSLSSSRLKKFPKNLKNIVKFGAYAFTSCTQLSDEFNASDNLTEIGQGSFVNTKIISFKSGKMSKIPSNCFETCPNLSSVVVTKYVNTIDNKAFNNNNITMTMLFEEKNEEDIKAMANYDTWFGNTNINITIKWYKTNIETGIVDVGEFVINKK